MPETNLKFTVDANGAITSVDKLGQSLTKLDNTTAKVSKGGLKGFTTGLADMKAGFDVLTGSLSGVVQFGAELNKLGTESRQMKESFDTLSGSNGVKYLEQMRASTRGLIPDVDLLRSGTKAMVLGLAQSGDQLAVLAKAGTVLGRVMGIDAAQGMETLTVAMSRVNQTMLLDNIGLSALAVTNRFKELKLTMSEQDAWSAAVLEEAGRKAKLLEGNLDGAGAGVKRLENAFTQLKTQAGENISYFVDQTVALVDALDKYNTAMDEAKKNRAIAADITLDAMGWAGGNSVYGNPGGNFANKGQIPESEKLYLGSPEMQQVRESIAKEKVQARAAWEAAIMQSELNKREAVRRARDMQEFLYERGRTRPGETMGSLYAAQAMERFGKAQDFNNNVQAMKTLNQIIAGGQALLDPYAKGVNKIAEAWNTAAEAAKRNSIASAFGTTGGGIFGEIGGSMGGLLDDARAKKQQELEKKFGKGSKQVTRGMAVFDADQKTAMDAYQIATGQATKASLAFDNQLASLQERFKSNKIDAKTYVKELYDLGIAAQSAGGDFEKFLQVTGRSAEGASKGDKAPVDKAAQKQKWGFGNSYTGPQKASGTTREEFDVTGDSPFAALQTGLGGLDKGIKDITASTQAMPNVFESSFSTAADKMKPLTKSVSDLNGEVARLLTQKSFVSITVIGFGGGSSGGGGGGGRKF